MKIDCDVLGSKILKAKVFNSLLSNREVLTQVKIVPLGDQEYILSCLSSYDVTCSTSNINEAIK